MTLDKEPLDVLHPDGTPTGRRKARAEVHRDGDWHRSFHLWIVKEERFVLLQRRSQYKVLEPNKLDVTVGGHFGAGETLESVLRETEEELGLTVSLTDLHPLGTWQVERNYSHATDREFQETYVMRCNQPLEDYVLNPKEVYVLYEVPLARAIHLYRHGSYVAAAGFDCYRRRNDALLIEDDLIQQSRTEVAEALERIQAWLKETGG